MVKNLRGVYSRFKTSLFFNGLYLWITLEAVTLAITGLQRFSFVLKKFLVQVTIYILCQNAPIRLVFDF